MADRDLPLGIRSNNPGNLEKTADKWQGLDHAATAASARFFVFKDATYGIRAIVRTLITYQDRYDLYTVRQMVGRWAPDHENPTGSYVNYVRKECGVMPGTHIDAHDHDTMKKLVCAIIKFENGVQPYSDAQITKGLVLAGLEPSQPPLSKSRTMKGGAVAMGATGLGGIVAAAQDAGVTVSPVLKFFQDVPWWVPVALGAVAIAGIMYWRWQDKSRGLR